MAVPSGLPSRKDDRLPTRTPGSRVNGDEAEWITVFESASLQNERRRRLTQPGQ